MLKAADCTATFVVAIIAAFFLFTAVMLGPVPGYATELVVSDGVIAPWPQSDRVIVVPGNLKSTLDSSDRLATLEAIAAALNEVEDGSTYFWQRAHGRLSGTFQLVRSFRNDEGRTCRYLVIALNSGIYIRRIEGVACRTKDGSWSLG